MTKIKKIFLRAIGIVIIILATSGSARAITVGGITGGAVDDAIGSAFSQLGIDINEVRYFTASFNASREKKQQPQMSLNFDPATPAPGQKVTVVATPKYFLNDISSLYFTWYLKPSGCPTSEDTSPSQERKEKCDFDGNGEINIEDYKVHAMRIIASNDFEWNKEDERGHTVYENARDNGVSGGEEYRASWGGDDQKGKMEHCYVHDLKTGDEYEIECDDHLFPNATDPDHTTGDDSYGLDEEKFWHTSPNDPDTADTGNGDEANVAGLGINSFTWTYDEGDNVGVVIEGVSTEPTQYRNSDSGSSYKTMWALVNNKCSLGDPELADGLTGTTHTDITQDHLDINENTEACPLDHPDEHIHDQITTTTERTIVRRTTSQAVIRTVITVTSVTDSDCNGVYDETSTEISKTTTCPNGPEPWQVDEDGDPIPTTFQGVSCVARDEIRTIDDDNLELENINKSSDLNNCLYGNMIDPKKGGGQAEKMDITLSYSPKFPINDTMTDSDQGDLIVVNSSITNAENDAFLKYQWEVFASDTPNPEDWGNPISKQYLKDATQTIGANLRSFQFRLNLNNDALGRRVSRTNRFYLKVKLSASENVPESINVSPGDNSNIVKREGSANVVIPITSNSERVRVFDTYASELGQEIKLEATENEKCLDPMDGAVCPVSKNEIISLQIDNKNLTNFSWKLDGKLITPVSESCISNDCNPDTQESTNIAYFPALSDPGTRHSVTLTAFDSDTGNQTNITKVFEVIDPTATISSADENVCVPALLGYYVDLDGKRWPDYSKTNFEALADTNIKLRANFDGFFPPQNNYGWIVNGVAVGQGNVGNLSYGIDENGDLTLPGKPLDGTYDVQLSALYVQEPLVKKALNLYWKVQYNEFYEKALSNSVSVKAVNYLDGIQTARKNDSAKSAKTKILASLYSATPAYLALLLRMMLTAFMMLISTRIILSFFPRVKTPASEI